MTIEKTLAHYIQQRITEHWPHIEDIEVELKRPPHDDFDWTCHSAFKIAALLKRPPTAIAEELLSLLVFPKEVALCEVAKPAFLNIRLSPEIRWSVVEDILTQGLSFGHHHYGQGQKIMFEFVSANPTGPLHVGHARQAAIGDTLASVFETQGWQSFKEFYYNDQGNQIQQLALSTQARALGHAPGEEGFPKEGYRGDYVADIAQAFLNQEQIHIDSENITITASGEVNNLQDIRLFSVAYLRNEQDSDIRAFGVQFDHYFLESSLYANGAIERVVERWQENGFCYEQEGALFLKTTCYGDDKDRVFKKSSGEYTYFTPDVAYHWNKYNRQFARVINIQGSDHQSTVIRVRAGLQALQVNIPTHFPEYVLHSMVKIVHQGEEIKVSKRAGTYVTLRDLLTLAGRDATRFFLVWRKTDSPFTFDIDLATRRTEDNPVYYIQYAHARICSMLAQSGERPLSQDVMTDDPEFLQQRTVIQLLKKLGDFPDILYTITRELSVHLLPHYLLELAGIFHHFYNAERVLNGHPQQESVRLMLMRAVALVLQQGLHLIGVSSPEKM